MTRTLPTLPGRTDSGGRRTSRTPYPLEGTRPHTSGASRNGEGSTDVGGPGRRPWKDFGRPLDECGTGKSLPDSILVLSHPSPVSVEDRVSPRSFRYEDAGYTRGRLVRNRTRLTQCFLPGGRFPFRGTPGPHPGRRPGGGRLTPGHLSGGTVHLEEVKERVGDRLRSVPLEQAPRATGGDPSEGLEVVKGTLGLKN